MLNKITIGLLCILLYTTQISAGILREVSEASCRVIAGNNCGSGTAILKDKNNIYVLTNYHVIQGYKKATVEFWKYGRKIPKPIIGEIIWFKYKEPDYDFALIQVPQSNIKVLPNIIPVIPDNLNNIQAGRYVVTAGCPLSQWLSIQEGGITKVTPSNIYFIPTPEDGQSGSGLFTQINKKTYLIGVVTARNGKDIIRNKNGFDITRGIALRCTTTTLHLTSYYKTVGKLYALGGDGRYYLQNPDGSVNVPPGTQIIQWNCPGPHVEGPAPMVPLPKPTLPPPTDDVPHDYGKIPPGLELEAPQNDTVTPPQNNIELPPENIEPKQDNEKQKQQIQDLKQQIQNIITQIDIPPQKETAKPTLLDKARDWSPVLLVLAGIAGTLLFPKLKVIGMIPGLVSKLFTRTPKIIYKQPDTTYIKDIENKFDELGQKLDDKRVVVNNNIDVDYTSVAPQGIERIKQFFDLKQHDGEPIEQWAVFAVLYKEAMQLLRQGKFTIDIVGEKITLQGQRLTADKIDSWVRDQYLQRLSIQKLQLDSIYHEAMLGFLYKEAVNLLRKGSFPVLGAKETADTIENWVKQEFMKRMGINL